jgi:hypothetical protein
MKEFTLDPCYITDVAVYHEWSMYSEKDSLTQEEMIKVLKGEGKCSSTSSDDHPQFKELREHLGEQGYISIERGWWNGDRVLKPFKLNGKKFKKGEQFPCGAAMSIHMKYMK